MLGSLYDCRAICEVKGARTFPTKKNADTLFSFVS